MNHELSRSLLGTYSGTCTNQKADPPITAGMVVILRRLTGNEVSGDLTLHGNLEGGSEFSGVLDGNRLTFVTRAFNRKMTITWIAAVSDGELSGGYVLTDDRPWTVEAGIRNQHGIWVCRKS